MIRRKKNKKNLTIKVIIGLLVFVAFSISLAICAYLMAVYKPSEYAPVPISRDMQEVAVDRAIALVADIHNNIYAEAEFTQTFNSKLINQLLLHDDLRKVLEGEFVGSELSLEHPQISLRDGLLIFYLTMNNYEYRVVISIVLKPYINNDGDLVIDLVKIKSGALGVPMSTVNKYIMQVASTISEYSESLRKSNNHDDEFNVEIGLYIGKTLPELLRNKRVVISPVITKPDDKNVSVKLTDITIADQKAALSFRQQKK